MAATSPLLLSLFILSFLHYGDSKTPLINVIEALEKLVQFYRSSYRGFNVDGLFGLRVVEGHVQLILNEYNEGHHQHIGPVLERLRFLSREATQVSNEALEYVRKDDEEYYNNFKFLIGSPWSVYKKHRGIDPYLKWLPKIYNEQKNSKLNEEVSDWCMGEMTGASHKYGRSCVISDRCLKTMTQRGYTEYSLTHQILWTMVAEKAGCTQELKKSIQDHGFPDVERLQLEFCTNNYYEMLAVVHIYMKGVIRAEYQDLFLEQQFVCPSIGFYEHLTKDYLDQILSWQKPSGCFGKSPGESDLKDSKDRDNNDDGEQVDNISEVAETFETMFQTRPKNIVKPSALDKLLKVMSPAPTVSLPLKFQPHQNKINQNIAQKSFQDQLQNQQGKFFKTMKSKMVDQQKQILRPSQNGLVQKGIHQIQPMANINEQIKPPNFHFGQQNVNIQNEPLQNLNMANANTQEIQKPLKSQGKESKNLKMFQQNMADSIPKLLPGKHQGKQPYSATGGPQRKLLVEKSMKGGCFSHKTAVAAGALVMYLRYLIDPGPLDLNASHLILPESSRSLLEKPDMSVGDSQKVKKEGLIPVKQSLNEEELAVNQMANMDDREGEDLGPDGDGEGGEGGEQSEEYEGDEDEDEDDGDEEGYEDKDMYPDKDEAVQDRKIVHFGADKEKGKDVNRFANVDGEGLVDDMAGALPKGDNPQGNNDDAEYTYYDEPDKEEKSVQQDGVKRDTHVVKSHHRIKSHSVQENKRLHILHEPKRQERLEKAMFIVFSVCFLVLFFLMYRFIKKRRIHIRYHPRTMFS